VKSHADPRLAASFQLAGIVLALNNHQKENEMKSIQLLVSGLFLMATLLWVRAAAQRCLENGFRQWQSRFSGKDDRP
jgi:hypothetical protein